MIKTGKPSIVYWLDNTLYLNITNRCSNKCWFCFTNYKKGVGDFNLKLDKEPSAAEIQAELQATISQKRWSEVVFCGFGEPTERFEVLLEIAQWIKRHYPKLLIRLDTNGHGSAINKDRNVPRELKAAGIRNISVSLNGWNEESYIENCRPKMTNSFAAVLEFVGQAKIAGLKVEVSAVRMPELDLGKIQSMANSLGVPLRIRDYVQCFW